MAYRLLLATALTTLGACSSTMHYEATGYYALDETTGEITQFDGAVACATAASDACTQVVMKWKTERYCGIYQSAPDSISDKHLRVGTSPTTLEGWRIWNDQTVWLGDDEEFASVTVYHNG